MPLGWSLNPSILVASVINSCCMTIRFEKLILEISPAFAPRNEFILQDTWLSTPTVFFATTQLWIRRVVPLEVLTGRSLNPIGFAIRKHDVSVWLFHFTQRSDRLMYGQLIWFPWELSFHKLLQ